MKILRVLNGSGKDGTYEPFFQEMAKVFQLYINTKYCGIIADKTILHPRLKL